MRSPSELVTYETGRAGHVVLHFTLETVCTLGTGVSSILGRSDESLQETLFFFSSSTNESELKTKLSVENNFGRSQSGDGHSRAGVNIFELINPGF